MSIDKKIRKYENSVINIENEIIRLVDLKEAYEEKLIVLKSTRAEEVTSMTYVGAYQ